MKSPAIMLEMNKTRLCYAVNHGKFEILLQVAFGRAIGGKGLCSVLLDDTLPHAFSVSTQTLHKKHLSLGDREENESRSEIMVNRRIWAEWSVNNFNRKGRPLSLIVM
ncbi:hypothetical protein L2E82_18390 [Cichorium intybus]|uniref:Uncharacterized protein n=1 Tax=Cichorium intybus TaxID=13427 RepID=A0ACB9FAG8_CICIN|nr:hypothetical protein L2E82_18390 [Cichorium intybus]